MIDALQTRPAETSRTTTSRGVDCFARMAPRVLRLARPAAGLPPRGLGRRSARSSTSGSRSRWDGWASTRSRACRPTASSSIRPGARRGPEPARILVGRRGRRGQRRPTQSSSEAQPAQGADTMNATLRRRPDPSAGARPRDRDGFASSESSTPTRRSRPGPMARGLRVGGAGDDQRRDGAREPRRSRLRHARPGPVGRRPDRQAVAGSLRAS